MDWNMFIGAFPGEYKGVLSADIVPKKEDTGEKELLQEEYRKLKKVGDQNCKK